MTTNLSHDVDAGADHAPTVSTRILHADRMADVGRGAVHAPMHTSVLYGYGSARELQEVFQGHKPGFTYARQGNPTGAALEAKLNLLEETRATICFATGMAAISATFFALLRAGDHVVSIRAQMPKSGGCADINHRRRKPNAVTSKPAHEMRVGRTLSAIRPTRKESSATHVAHPTPTERNDAALLSRAPWARLSNPTTSGPSTKASSSLLVVDG